MTADCPDLREFIRTRRAALAGFMEQGCALALEGEVLRVFPRNDIYIRYLNDNRVSIAQLASEFYGRKLRVEVSLSGADADTAAESAAPPRASRSFNGRGASADATTVADSPTCVIQDLMVETRKISIRPSSSR